MKQIEKYNSDTVAQVANRREAARQEMGRSMSQLLPQSLEAHRLSKEQQPHTALKDADPALCQSKLLIRIEATTIVSPRPDDIGKRRVFYLEHHLTSEGKIDSERLLCEILALP